MNYLFSLFLALLLGFSACTGKSGSPGDAPTQIEPSEVTGSGKLNGGGYGGIIKIKKVIHSTRLLPGASSAVSVVTIQATNFQEGVAIKVNGQSCGNVVLLSSAEISCALTTLITEINEVVMTNPNGQSGVFTNTTSQTSPPVVTSLSVNSGPIAGGTALTIQGTGFQNAATVSLGGSGCGISYLNSIQVNCVTSPHSVGTVDLVLTNPDGQFSTVVAAFSYQAPAAPSWVGTRQFGVPGGTADAISQATDTSGNLFVGGNTNGPLDGSPLLGINDGFITKYNSLGTRLWTQHVGVANGWITPGAVATDTSGNVFMSGTTDKGLDGNLQAGTYDLFVTKLDSTGARQWTRQIGVSGFETQGKGVATDTSGNVVVSGYTKGSVDGNTRTGFSDLFIIKYDASGTKLWSRQLGVSGSATHSHSVAIATSGDIYVGGSTWGGLDGNSQLGTEDAFITKYDAFGVKQWTRQLGIPGGVPGNLQTRGNAVAVDPSGNVFIAGYTTAGLDGNTLMGSFDFYVSKFNASGTKLWTRQLGANGNVTIGNALATDPMGNVFVNGNASGGLDGIAAIGSSHSFITKYDASGVKLFTKLQGAWTGNTYGYGVACDASGSVFMGGFTSAGLDGNTLSGTHDFFVTKYSSAGVKQ